ncbi:MAG: hypothetical protein Phog2KO_40610 [Phototrophicaceae bacterium]
MLKKLVITTIVLLMMSSISMAQDSTSDWSAYLFDNINYDLIRVDADGNTNVFSLGLAENELLSLNELAVSHDGALVAYCKTIHFDDNETLSNEKILIIREIETGENIQEITFGIPPSCSVTAFSEDDSQIALSLVSLAFSDEPSEESAWSLRLINVTSGVTEKILNDGDDIMPAFDMFGENIPLNADVRQFNAESLTFAGIPFVGMGGPPALPVYQWDFASDTITQFPQEFGRVNSDILASTGELAYPALDEALTAVEPEGPISQANVVNVLSADGTVTTIYQNEDRVIASAQFINDGQAVAIISLSGFLPNQDMTTANLLQVDIVNRDGDSMTLDKLFDGGVWIESISEGMLIVYTPNPNENGMNSTQILVWTEDTLTEIASYLPDYSSGFSPLQLLWVSPSMTMTDELSAFVPVN